MKSNFSLYIPVTDGAGIGNTLKGFISALSICDDVDVKIQCNINSILGDFSKIIDEKFIVQNDDDLKKRDIFSSCRFLIKKEEEEYQFDLSNEYSCYTAVDLSYDKKYWYLFSQKVMIDWYFERKLIHDKVFERIQNGIKKIIWKQEIMDEVDKTCQQIQFPALGVSIRTWNAQHSGDRGCTRPYNKEEYMKKMQNIIDNYAINTIFMSYDNHNVIESYDSFLKDYKVITYVPTDDIDLLQIAIIKILILSKCEYFVCNRISTFAELVFWFGECKQIVQTVF
jgi:hypothetical protein